MAQLNPNFEIDFSDINSYEQIQLINDAQLAKENLLMHRAYKEPSDDEIIRNHFSSFTFVDFCPKLFPRLKCAPNSQQQQQVSNLGSSTTLSGLEPGVTTVKGSNSTLYYDLETFSELFERINAWIKLNKDWRVVSMETLVYDCTTQFNQLKSSIYSAHLPQNTRGLRLFLSPSKSRFSGSQKIGCINVVPRRVSGSHTDPERKPVVYETLDDILARLNELLLTRPIEGRILSVETITLPMADGYVNTESNYFLDSRLNLLNEHMFNMGADNGADCQSPEAPVRGHSLVDILRVYYEFGPTLCGLVNLIDFVPRFYPATVGAASESDAASPAPDGSSESLPAGGKICATESLTRLIRRSLAWFEAERKHTLCQQVDEGAHAVNLRLCNLQVHHKTLLKRQLVQVTPGNVLQLMNTRSLAQTRASSLEAVACKQCNVSSSDPAQDWCAHLSDLSQPYQVKFVRLAYAIPVHSRHSVRPLRPLRAYQRQRRAAEGASAAARLATRDAGPDLLSSSSSSASDESSPDCAAPFPLDCCELASALAPDVELVATADAPAQGESAGEDKVGPHQGTIELIRATGLRHAQHEAAHQSSEVSHDALNDSPIGQLTYRLFAPCQLVNSSSCFSINPVNSSSPLARRGSVDLNGTGLSSDNAHPSTLLLGPGSRQTVESQHVVTSFGAFFPALSQDLAASSLDAALSLTKASPARETLSKGQPANRFTTNEFEPVDAIRRRMEIYVTTNSMKVVSGETLIVNLSDALSCLSTAIEQTLSKAPQLLGKRARPSTWVSVYILYATVQEAQLPEQLLAQQRLRELSLISEEPDARAEPDAHEILFEDQFRSTPEVGRRFGEPRPSEPTLSSLPSAASLAARSGSAPQTDGPATLYNSAYDRTVALPTLPE